MLGLHRQSPGLGAINTLWVSVKVRCFCLHFAAAVPWLLDLRLVVLNAGPGCLLLTSTCLYCLCVLDLSQLDLWILGAYVYVHQSVRLPTPMLVTETSGHWLLNWLFQVFFYFVMFLLQKTLKHFLLNSMELLKSTNLSQLMPPVVQLHWNAYYTRRCGGLDSTGCTKSMILSQLLPLVIQLHWNAYYTRRFGGLECTGFFLKHNNSFLSIAIIY